MLYEWADHRLFTVGDGAILFGVDHASLFLIDSSVQEVLSRWASSPTLDLSRASGSDREVLEGLRDIYLLVPAGATKKWPPVRFDPKEFPLTTMVLEVAQDCNLRCTYCYAEGGAYGGAARLLDSETARAAARYLVDKSGDSKSLTLVLFGGEPLLNMPAVKAAVEEAETTAAAAGKKLLVSLTTNGTLLTAEAIDFFRNHRVVVSVSLDGPPDLHDANRPDAAGEGSYARILPKLRGLLENSTAAVAARVTLIPDQWTRCEEVFDHLMGLGFHEVGISPASPMSRNLLPDPEQEEALLQSFAAMARRFATAAREGRMLPFGNLLELLGRLHTGQTKAVACGAGYGYLAVDAIGEFYLCHRMAGDKDFEVGSLKDGADPEKIRSCLDHVTAGKNTMCESCWARALCAGGCHYENHLRENTLGIPAGSSCNFILRWLQIGIELYAELRHAGADKLLAHLEKRTGC
jgi:uncharacterized protein